MTHVFRSAVLAGAILGIVWSSPLMAQSVKYLCKESVSDSDQDAFIFFVDYAKKKVDIFERGIKISRLKFSDKTVEFITSGLQETVLNVFDRKNETVTVTYSPRRPNETPLILKCAQGKP